MPQDNDILKNKKILICSHEIGNQMQLMAEELRRKGYYATAATYTTEWYGFRNDINLNLQDEERKLFRHYKEIMFFLFAASNYDIFHFHFGTTLYGTRLVPHIDLPLLHALGKKIFIHYRGRDLIDMSYYDYLNSKYEGVEKDMVWKKMNKKQKNSLRIFRKYSENIFISTPDLFMNAPEAVLVPQVIRLQKNNYSKKTNRLSKGKTIKIVHAPTSRRKKGTKFIIRSIDELIELGYPIELILVENIPANDVQRIFGSCDFGIDQVISGWYGKVSIELMLAGKPVFCNVEDGFRHGISEVPIVNVNPNNLTNKLKYFLDHPAELNKLVLKGIDYVKSQHDVSAVIKNLIYYYRHSFRTG